MGSEALGLGGARWLGAQVMTELVCLLTQDCGGQRGAGCARWM